MSVTREQLLQQLGIIQYRLRRPSVLRGEVALFIPQQVRLLIVANTTTTINQRFLDDILQTMQLTKQDVILLEQRQAVMLTEEQLNNRIIWLAGCKECLPIIVPQDRLLTTSDLMLLMQQPIEKRSFWRQIYQHENENLISDNSRLK